MYKIEMKDGYLLQNLEGSLQKDEIIKFTEEAIKIVRKPGNKIRILNDYRGSFLHDPDVQTIMKEWVSGNETYVEKAAVLGITGIKKIFYNIITIGRKHIKLFENEEEAIKWLKS